MRIYRVEHKVRRHGPYAGSASHLNAFRREFCTCGAAIDHRPECESHEAEDFHMRLMYDTSIARPAPREDGLGFPAHEHVIYGFISLTALWEWFDEFLDDLDHYGYTLVEYQAYGYAEVGHSGQVAFDLRDAMRVD